MTHRALAPVHLFKDTDWALAASLTTQPSALLLCDKAAVLQTSTWRQCCGQTSLLSCVSLPPDSPVLTSRVAVTVHVLDINEFPPELASPYETFVCENAKMGQVGPDFTFMSVNIKVC